MAAVRHNRVPQARWRDGHRGRAAVIAAGGFTLIELMVSVGVVGILLGMLLPAMAKARERALEAQSLANLHNLGLTIEAHTQIHKGAYPFPTLDDAARASGNWGPFMWSMDGQPPNADNALQTYQADVFGIMETHWPTLLHDVAPWPEHFETWLSPGLKTSGWTGPIFALGPSAIGYHYCHSFIAKPVVWSAGPASRDDIAPIRTDLVASPAGKVMFFDAIRAYLRTKTADSPRPALRADGSASANRDLQATAPAPNLLRRGPLLTYHDTPMGVQGRDF